MKKFFTLCFTTILSYLSYAQAPSTQASGITFDPLTNAPTTLNVNWNSGTNSNNVLVVIRDSTAVFSPVDNTNYAATPTVNFSTATDIKQGGTGKAVAIYNASPNAASFTESVTNLSVSGHYVVQIFEYAIVTAQNKYNTNTAVDNPMYVRIVSTAGSTSWQLPGGIKKFNGQAWGSGGGGGYGKNGANGGAGGGGGAYSKAAITYTTNNESYTVLVAAAGSAGIESSSTAAGGSHPSSIALGATMKVEANGGGAGPSNNTTAGNGGPAGTVSVGSGFDGGKGGAGGGGTGAAGGSSGGTGQTGASATDGNATAPATRTGGGAAGGGSGGGVGTSGKQPGGGGGGGGDANGGDGGAGGPGMVIISYKLRPNALSATLDYGSGLLVVLMSEAVNATTDVDGTKFHINNVTGTNVVTLTNAEVSSVNTGAKTVTFALTGPHLTSALAISGVPGGDGGAVVLDVSPYAITAASGNSNINNYNLTVVESSQPTISSATLNYGTGVLVITASRPITLVDATKIHISNVTGSNDVTLSPGEFTGVAGNTMTFTLTEANRLLARSLSGTTGGDGGAVVLDVSAGAVKDSGNTPNPDDFNNTVTETADAIAPAVSSGTIDYGTGIMVVTLTEGLTLTTQADGTKFHVNNVTGTDVVTLTQAEISGVNQGSRTLTFQLTEAHRIAAIAISGTPGGNGGAAILDVDLGGLTDPIGNVSVTNSDNTTLTETADGTAPTIASATLDYNTGIMVVTISEGLPGVASVDGTKFHVNDVTGSNDVTLTNAEVTSVNQNGKTITFTLTEAHRVAALQLSGTPGGNTGAVVLDVGAAGITDAGLNPNAVDNNNPVTETADTTKPTVTSAAINYGTGVMVVTLSENISGTGAVDGTKFHISNVTTSNDINLTSGEVTGFSANTVTFTLTEAHRIAAIAISGTAGGDGGAVVLDVDAAGITDFAGNTSSVDNNNPVTETADTIKPTITSATLDYGTGILVVQLSETVKTLAGVDGTKFHLNNVTGTNITTLSNAERTSFNQASATITFTLTEANRVTALANSGVAGGNGGAVVLDVDPAGVTDVANNTNNADPNNPVTETADTTPPTVTSATLNYGTGVLVVTVSEGIPMANVVATDFHINNVTGTNLITLSGPELTSVNLNGTTITFTLTEANRLAARAVSGTTGGDGGAVVLDVDAGGITDAGNNPNATDNNNPVTETADTIAPAVASAATNYGTGVMVVTLTEGLTATTQADGTKFHINNVTGTNVVTLTQAEITGFNQASRTVTFTLTEAHRVAAIAISGTPGGNGGAAILDVGSGGLTDPIGNVSASPSNNTALSETADTIIPVASAPTPTAQILKSGTSSTSTVASNESASNIYLVKNGTAATSQAQIDAAVTAHNAFQGVTGANKNQAYTVNPVASLNSGVYDIVVVDLAGNVSTVVAGWLTVDNTAPTVVLSDDQSDAVVRDADNPNITATFTEANGLSGTPTISIAGLTVPVSNVPMTATGDPLVWTYPWNVPAGDDGAHAVSVSVSDVAGNANAAATGRTSYTIDNTFPATLTVTTLTPVNGRVHTGYWNSTNTQLDVAVPLTAGDVTLDGGTVQIEIQNTTATGYIPVLTSGVSTIISTDRTTGGGIKTISITQTDFENAHGVSTGFQEGKTLNVHAIVTDLAGNATTYNQSVSTLIVDQTLPTIIGTPGAYANKGSNALGAGPTTGNRNGNEVIQFKVSEPLVSAVANPPHPGTLGAVATNSAVITGTGTAFSSLSTGWVLVAANGGLIGTIQTIGGNGSITLAQNAATAQAAGGAYYVLVPAILGLTTSSATTIAAADYINSGTTNGVDNTQTNTDLIYLESNGGGGDWATNPPKIFYTRSNVGGTGAGNYIVDVAGNEMATDGVGVQSGTGDLTPPTLQPVQAVLYPRGTNPERIVMTFSEPLGTLVGGALTGTNNVTGFSVTPNPGSLIDQTYTEASPGVCPCTITLTSNNDNKFILGTTQVSYLAGNVGDQATPSNALAPFSNLPLTLETTPPSIVSVSIPIAPMIVGSTVNVTITTLDDDLDNLTTLTSGTIGGGAGFTLVYKTGGQPTFNTSGTIKSAQFTVTNGGTDIASGSDIPVTNLVLTDGSGNASATYTNPNAISQTGDPIDANKPTLAAGSILFGQPIIYEGQLTQTVTVTYNEPMKNTVQPSIILSGGTWGGQTANGGTNGWTSATTYSATFAHTGPPFENINSITALVGSTTPAQDAAGNTQLAPTTSTATFKLDNVKPTASVTATSTESPNNIINLGHLDLTVTVTFSEAMNPAVTPAITGLPNFTISVPGAWSGGNTIYTVVYTHDGSFEGPTPRTVDVNSGKDANGNVQTTSGTAAITVDTVVPTVTSISRQTPASQFMNSSIATYTVVFSEYVNVVAGSFSPYLVSTAGGSPLPGSVSGFSTLDHITYNVSISGAAGDGVIRLDVPASASTKDQNGNPLTGGLAGDFGGNTGWYTIDQSPPTVNSIVIDPSLVDSWSTAVNGTTPSLHSNQVTYTVTFSEPVNGLDLQLQDFNGTAVPKTISAGGPPYNYNPPYNSFTSYAPLNIPYGSVAPVGPAPAAQWIVTENYASGTGTFEVDFHPHGVKYTAGASTLDFLVDGTTNRNYVYDQSWLRGGLNVGDISSLQLGSEVYITSGPSAGEFLGTVTTPVDGSVPANWFFFAPANSILASTQFTVPFTYQHTTGPSTVIPAGSNTGTISSTVVSSTVTGTATLFTQQVLKNDLIFDATGTLYIGTVLSITNDNTLVLKSNARNGYSGTFSLHRPPQTLTSGGSAIVDQAGNPISTISFIGPKYTFALPQPTNPVTVFDATAVNASSVNLQWTNPTGGAQEATHYLIVASPEGTTPSVNNGAYQLNAANLIYNVPKKGVAGSTQSFTFNTSANYDFAIYPYTMSPLDSTANASTVTINYNNTVDKVSTLSDIVHDNGFAYPTSIDYASFPGPFTANTDGVKIEQFILRDGGLGHNDADSKPTILQSIKLSFATSSNIGDINTVALYNGTTKLQELPMTAAVGGVLTFSSLGGFNAPDDDGLNTKLSVYATFVQSTAVHDHDIINIQLVSASVAATGSSSIKFNGSTLPVTNFAYPTNGIDVIATKLDFTSPPVGATASLNSAFTSVYIRAEDANNNLDIDYSGGNAKTVTGFTNNASSPTVTMTGGPANGDAFTGGVIDFSVSYTNFKFTSGNNNQTFTLTMNSSGTTKVPGGLTGTSNVIALQVSTDSYVYFDPAFTAQNFNNFVNQQATTMPASGALTDPTIALMAQLKLSDGGAAAHEASLVVGPVTYPSGDTDLADTHISGISFSVTGAGVGDIRKLALYDNAGNILGTEQTISGGVVSFSGFNITATDQLTTTFTLRGSFNNNVNADQDDITFKVAGVTWSAGSQIYNDGVGAYKGGINGGATSPTNTVDVLATSLDFVDGNNGNAPSSPSAYAGINEPVGPSYTTAPLPSTTAGIVTARDKYGNVDTNFAPTSISLYDDAAFTANPSSPAYSLIPPAGGLAFNAGVMNLDGMQYPKAVGIHGKITVVTTGSSYENITGPNGGSAVACGPVNVLDVSVSIDTNNGVLAGSGGPPPGQPLKGGQQGVNLFGLNFTANATAGSEPQLKRFTISFKAGGADTRNWYLDAQNSTVIFSGFKVFIGGTANDVTTFISGSTVTPTSSLGNQLYDQIVVTLGTAQTIGSGLQFYLVADVDPSTNTSTQNLIPYFVDAGYGAPSDKNSIVTNGTSTGVSNGSIPGEFDGAVFSFASTQPPTLRADIKKYPNTKTYPYAGQSNVDPALSTITLEFDTNVGVLDDQLTNQYTGEVWDRGSNTKVADLILNQTTPVTPYLAPTTPAVQGSVVGNTVAAVYPKLVFDIVNKTIPTLINDNVYFVKIRQGSYDPISNVGHGITDFGLNFFGGITDNSTLYFKISSSTPIVLKSASSVFDTKSVGTLTTMFDQLGTSYYFIENGFVSNPGTGTITSSTISTTVTGTGTLFLTEVAVGSILKTSAGAVIGKINSITSDTQLTLSANAAVSTAGAYSYEALGTGTITSSLGSTSVTGSGTSFTTEVAVGSILKAQNGTVIGAVASVASNTSLTLAANANVALTGGVYALPPVPPTQNEILGLSTYGGNATVAALGSYPITSVNANQTATFGANFFTNSSYDVFLFAQNNAQPSPVSATQIYSFPALISNIAATQTSTTPNVKTYTICPDSYVQITDPLIVGETSNASFFGAGPQDFNVLLPTGFEFDVTVTPTVQLIGADFSPTWSYSYPSNTVLNIKFSNSGSSSLDFIAISGVSVTGKSGSSQGAIQWFYGNNVFTPSTPVFELAKISLQVPTIPDFTNSYWYNNQLVAPFPSVTASSPVFNAAADKAIIKTVNAIPDNYVDQNNPGAVRLLPMTPPYLFPPTVDTFNPGDFLASFYSGAGVSGDLLTLNAVTAGAAFNIFINHTDLNGCATTKKEQYVVYDHNSPISKKLGSTLNGSLDALGQTSAAGTKQDIVNTNFPNAKANPAPSQQILYNELAGYQLLQLTADLPASEIALNASTPPSSQIISSQIISGPAWRTLVKGVLNPAVIANTNYNNYTWNYARILNADTAMALGSGISNVYDFFKSGVAPGVAVPSSGNNFWTGGSLGKIEFTGAYQSTADNSVYIPFRQNVELFVPSVPLIEVVSPKPTYDPADVDLVRFNNTQYPGGYPGAATFCEQGGTITLNAFPVATSTASGKFAIYDKADYNSTGAPRGGTITASGTSSSVTGVGTHFTTDVKIGSLLYDGSGNLIGKVLSVAGDLNLTLESMAAVVPAGSVYNSGYSSVNPLLVPGLSQFIDNHNGSMTLDPTVSVIRNSYKDVMVTYTFKENTSPAFGTGYLVIRVTANPVATFTINSTPGLPGPSTFDAFCASPDPTHPSSIAFNSTSTLADQGVGNTIDLYSWNFGDQNAGLGNLNTDPNPSASHYYSASGSYSVSLALTSHWGCQSLVVVDNNPALQSSNVLYNGSNGTIKVGAIPTPLFSFVGNCVGDNINFDGSASTLNGATNGGTVAISQWVWDFGDGSPGSGSTSSHQYGLPGGRFSVNLTTITNVAGTHGCQNSLTKTIVQLPTFAATATNSYQEDFTSGNGGWIALDVTNVNSNGSWAWGQSSGKKTFNTSSTSDNIWVTSLSGTYGQNEKSSLYSVCLDLSNLPRPMLSYSSFVDVAQGEGLVLEYSVDKYNVTDPAKTWKVLGSYDANTGLADGLDWYNAAGLPSAPGDAAVNQTGNGWSGPSTTWIHPKHELDIVKSTSASYASSNGLPDRAILRFALSTLSSSAAFDGVGIDTVFVGSRTRTIMFENFTSTDGGNSTVNNMINVDMDSISKFNARNVGTQLVNINYHIGFLGVDPFNLDDPADPSSRALYYNVKTVPYAFLDGQHSPQYATGPDQFGGTDLFGDWGQRAYDLQTLKLAKADFSATTPPVNNADGSIEVDVKFTPVVNLPAGTTLQVAIVEEDVLATQLPSGSNIQTGETHFEYVLKKMIPNAVGTKYTTGLPKNTAVDAGAFKWIPEKLYTNQLAVVLFLQNEDTKEIYQAELYQHLTPPAPVTAIEPITADQIKVYPNPADQEFTLELPSPAQQNMKLTMANQLGQFTDVGAIGEGELSKKISTQGLAEGVYILQLGSNGNALRTKVVVLHK